jgi:hypothetical protein
MGWNSSIVFKQWLQDSDFLMGKTVSQGVNNDSQESSH